MSVKPMRYCFFCGERLGRYTDYDPLDTCGEHECERVARDERERERADAHEQLDRDRGFTDA